MINTFFVFDVGSAIAIECLSADHSAHDEEREEFCPCVDGIVASDALHQMTGLS